VPLARYAEDQLNGRPFFPTAPQQYEMHASHIVMVDTKFDGCDPVSWIYRANNFFFIFIVLPIIKCLC
jgi:hypothetical protein